MEMQCKITPMLYAESVLPESMIFQNGAANQVRPIVFYVYLIQTEGRAILVDAGCETMPDFDMKNFIGPVKALSNMGIRPEEITDLILTHAHHDHIECTKYFTKAAVYIQKDEYEEGKSYIQESAFVHTFDESYTVWENGEAFVRIQKIGGHTKGSCIVEIRDAGKTFVIAGDECYARECLEKQIPTGCSYCLEKSRWFVEEYSKPDYTVLLCHDQ